MAEKYTAKASIEINATPAEVWKALTDPEMISQYLFGTQVTTDWMVGSPISYKGNWEGKEYEDKGTILEIIPEKILRSTYWSSISGTEDIPENYAEVAYEIVENGPVTTLTVIQSNIDTEETKNHSEENWKMVLQAIKNLLEK